MKFRLLLLIVAVIAVLPHVQAGEKNKKLSAGSVEFKVHPKVFSLVAGWLSDGESPIVTEINLDAVEKSANQFDPSEIKQDDGWVRSQGRDGQGFLRYRVLEKKGATYKLTYQENGGGSLTTEAAIECIMDKRRVAVDGKPITIRVLRVISFVSASKQ